MKNKFLYLIGGLILMVVGNYVFLKGDIFGGYVIHFLGIILFIIFFMKVS